MQLPEPATRSGERVEPLRIERNRLRSFEQCGAVESGEPTRDAWPPERIGDLRLAPLPTQRGVQYVERPLSTVGDWKFVDLGPPIAIPRRALPPHRGPTGLL